MNPLISIIIPIYNVEKYLKKCLLSIKDQTYGNFEAICINDGSKDHSEKIFFETVGSDPRFKYYIKKNGGLSSVRNLGLSLAQGELISFVDSDDTIESSYLEELVKGIVEYDCDISICGHNINYPHMTLHSCFPKTTIMNQKTALSLLMSDMMIKNYSWGKCYKKKLWKDIRFPENKTYEDVETTCRLFMRSSRFYISNKRLYNYEIRKGSISQQKAAGRNRELKRAYRHQMEIVTKKYPFLKIFGYMNLLKADMMHLYDVITTK
ncbi:glycosyltransferase family 2 protein [uncultured Traorella sp.]|uniref:glycosyltransferase family 2 protein n=1 Tax=uncultured Traorella sp. TaxID=1929048 RepID=UPI0025FBE304|nr:glycosyltransferase family 2 protein [uncultured Traorella sp.]